MCFTLPCAVPNSGFLSANQNSEEGSSYRFVDEVSVNLWQSPEMLKGKTRLDEVARGSREVGGGEQVTDKNQVAHVYRGKRNGN